MILESICLTNFRCFEELDLQLDPAGIVIVGRNAAGKTALLDAIAIALGVMVRHSGGNLDRQLEVSDIRQQRRLIDGTLVTENQLPLRIEVAVRNASVTDVRFLIEATRADDVHSSVHQAMQSLSTAFGRTPPTVLPAFAMYASHRAASSSVPIVDVNGALRSTPSRTEGYSSALRDKQGLQSFVQALAREELISLQEGTATARKLLLEKAISDSIEGNPLPRFNIRESEVMFDFKQSSVVRYSELSDGQRSTLNLVADLAVRCSALNPHLGENASSQTPGVVLIDELDLHLHPAWQRTIFSGLKRTFPKIQFITTTHSPQVIGEVDPTLIRILKDGTSTRPTQSLGMDSAWILDHLLETSSRSIEAQTQLIEISDLIARFDLDTASERLQAVKDKFGIDSEIQRLESKISKLQLFT